jgi:hypothetical protein
MKWTYSIKQKTTTAILLAAILGLVMWNNFEQSRQFEKMANSFSSLYEDRLIAESYIYRISELIHRKRQMIDNPLPRDTEKTFEAVVLQSDTLIEGLMDQYRETELTVNESKHFEHLLSGMESLAIVEKEYLASEPDSENNLLLKGSIKTLLDRNLQDLSNLSDIQIAEGKQMNRASKATLMSNVASSQLETTFLIIIAVIIQMLIFASRSMRSLLTQKPNLN